jgi:hypothetical protein
VALLDLSLWDAGLCVDALLQQRHSCGSRRSGLIEVLETDHRLILLRLVAVIHLVVAVGVDR